MEGFHWNTYFFLFKAKEGRKIRGGTNKAKEKSKMVLTSANILTVTLSKEARSN